MNRNRCSRIKTGSDDADSVPFPEWSPAEFPRPWQTSHASALKFAGLLMIFTLLLWVPAGCGTPNEADRAIAEIHGEIRDVFDRFKEAIREDDLEQLYDVSSRESVKGMLFEAIVAMGSTAQSPESEQILKQHINQEKLTQIGNALKNPNEQQVKELYMVCIEDPRQMFLDAYRYLRKLQPEPVKPVFGDLSDIKVTGNVALAQTTLQSNLPPAADDDKSDQKQGASEPIGTTVYFIRVDGKWLHATEAEWAGRIRQ